MIKREIQFPIRHLEHNLVFSTDGTVHAYYRIPLVDYTYRSPNEKFIARRPWINMFLKVQRDFHILVIPKNFDIQEHHKQLIQSLPKNKLYDFSKTYVERIAEVLQESNIRPITSSIYIGFRLDTTKAKASRRNARLGMGTNWSFKLKDLKRYLYSLSGLAPHEILDKELAIYLDQEQTLYRDISSCMPNISRIQNEDLQLIIRHFSYRGIKEPEIKPNWYPRTEKYIFGDHKVIRTNQRDIQVLLNGEYEVNTKEIYVKQFVDGKERTGYMRFLYFSYMPDQIEFPGDEWLYWVQFLRFPVDISIRVKVIPTDKAAEMIGRNKRRLAHHITHTLEEGQQEDLDLEHAYSESVEEEKEIRRGRYPLLETTTCFCVYSDSKKDLDEKTQRLISLYANYNKEMEIVVPPGDQFAAFHEFLPGGKQYVTDFKHKLKPDMLASSMCNASQFLGDSDGMFIGYTGPMEFNWDELDQPVFVNQAKAAQGGSELDTKSLGIFICGMTGYGKSHSSSLLIYQSILSLGARVLLIDAKGERGNWVTDLPGLEGQVSLIRLGSDRKYSGMLDPFALFPEQDAPMYAVDFLSQLVQVERRHEWHLVIKEAVEKAKTTNPCMEQVLNNIQQLHPQLYKMLSLYRNFPFSHLVFGDGSKKDITLNLNKPLNIIQIDELKVPDREKSPSQYNELETLSKALMLPISGFVQKVIKQNREIFKQVWWEECWIPMSSELGADAINEGIRMGRYWNAGTLLVSQNPSDIPDKLMNNIGMRFVFKTIDEGEITKALVDILKIEDNEENREAIKSLKEGECFFRDIYGRVGRMYFDVLFEDLKKAFDTTPPLKQTKDMEEMVP